MHNFPSPTQLTSSYFFFCLYHFTVIHFVGPVPDKKTTKITTRKQNKIFIEQNSVSPMPVKNKTTLPVWKLVFPVFTFLSLLFSKKKLRWYIQLKTLNGQADFR